MKPILPIARAVSAAILTGWAVSAFAVVTGSAPAGNDPGCPNTTTKKGVYAPCVGYLPPGATSASQVRGVHHLSTIPGVLVPSLTPAQAAAKGLLPGNMGTPSFGMLVAVSLAGGAGQQNPTSPPPPPPSCPCGVTGGYTWSGWDATGWVGGYSCIPCPPPDEGGGGGGGGSNPMDGKVACNGAGCVLANGQVVDTQGNVVGHATVQNGNIQVNLFNGNSFGLNTNGGASYGPGGIQTSNPVNGYTGPQGSLYNQGVTATNIGNNNIALGASGSGVIINTNSGQVTDANGSAVAYASCSSGGCNLTGAGAFAGQSAGLQTGVGDTYNNTAVFGSGAGASALQNAGAVPTAQNGGQTVQTGGQAISIGYQ